MSSREQIRAYYISRIRESLAGLNTRRYGERRAGVIIDLYYDLVIPGIPYIRSSSFNLTILRKLRDFYEETHNPQFLDIYYELTGHDMLYVSPEDDEILAASDEMMNPPRRHAYSSHSQPKRQRRL